MLGLNGLVVKTHGSSTENEVKCAIFQCIQFAEQFDNVPSYKEYAEVVAKRIADHYKEIPIEKRPLLFTEPGTTLINKYVDFLGKIETIKQIREKNFAVLNCSIHNLGEACLLKDLPVDVIPFGRKQENYDSIDFTGYTCLEQDVMRKNYEGNTFPPMGCRSHLSPWKDENRGNRIR